MSVIQIIIIWAWCPFCSFQTNQVFSRDEGKFEVYVCDNCGHEHKVAVR